MAFGENVTRISLAATTKKYIQKKEALLEFVDYIFLINSVRFIIHT